MILLYLIYHQICTYNAYVITGNLVPEQCLPFHCGCAGENTSLKCEDAFLQDHGSRQTMYLNQGILVLKTNIISFVFWYVDDLYTISKSALMPSLL